MIARMKWVLRLSILSLFILVGVSCSKPDDINDTKQKAEQGDAAAQYKIGRMYAKGEGVERNPEEADKWYKKAVEGYHKVAEQGDAEAQFKLGLMYKNGQGVEKNLAEAAKWYRKSAEQGNVAAQNALGSMYAKGEGVEKNPEEAFKWYSKAAEQGDVAARFFLNSSRFREIRLKKVFVECLEMAKQGNAVAQFKLGLIYSNGQGVEKNLEEADKWYKKAVEGYRKAAEQGNAEAQYNLGLMYDNGLGVEQNLAEALKWYSKAAEQGNSSAQTSLNTLKSEQILLNKNFVKCLERAKQGNAEAQYELGSMYEKGQGVEKNHDEAYKWYEKAVEGYRKAAEQGDAKAQFSLGWMYEKGQGVEKNPEEADKWYKKAVEGYRKAAEQGNAEAQDALGSMYAKGEGVEKNPEEADKWYKKAVEGYRKAAEQGDAKAQFSLGWMYESGGRGVEKNSQEAIKWFSKAAEQGDSFAQDSLDFLRSQETRIKKVFVERLERAEQGNADDQYMIGLMYAEGEGVGKNLAEAVKWYRKSAEQGNVDAQFNLGVMYAKGEGVVKDEIEALAWFNLAAISGDTDSIKNRSILEERLGREMTFLAQQRSKELVKLVEQNKAKKPTSENKSPQTSQGEYTGNGTGVVVSGDGLILTAAHVVGKAKQIKVFTRHGLIPARVLQVDESNDLALIKCEGTFDPLPVAGSKGTKLGQSVFTIGFPNVNIQGFNPKVTKGEINSLSGMQDDPRQFQISVPVQPGNSGGPLINEKGEVVGIVVAKLSAVKMAKATGDIPQNVNYAIKGTYAMPLLEPYTDRLPESKNQPENQKFEDLVERVKNAVVMILIYE